MTELCLLLEVLIVGERTRYVHHLLGLCLKLLLWRWHRVLMMLLVYKHYRLLLLLLRWLEIPTELLVLVKLHHLLLRWKNTRQLLGNKQLLKRHMLRRSNGHLLKIWL